MSNKLLIKIIIILIIVFIGLTIFQNIQIAKIITKIDKKENNVKTDYLIHTRIL